MNATYQTVSEAIVKASGFTMDELSTKSRKREKVLTRQVVFYALAMHKMASLSTIGSIFGRDHATVMHAKRVILDILDTKYPASQYNLVLNLVNAGNENLTRNNHLPEVQRQREDRKAVARWAYRNKLGNYYLPTMPRRSRYDAGNSYNCSARIVASIKK